MLIRPVRSSVLNNTCSTNNLPASIATSSFSF
nr:MAG TPA: hypothetical protein [Caudoviricetes sp.]